MKNKFEYTSENKITAQVLDSVDDYLWIAFLGSANSTTMYKVSTYNPDLIYWDFTVIANEVNNIWQDTTYLYLATDGTYAGAKVLKSTPSTVTYYAKPSGIIEESVDCITDATYIYFLLPGIISGENAKILKYNKTTLAYVSTLNLPTIYNASKMTTDLTNFWVCTYTDPMKLIKITISSMTVTQINLFAS